MPGSQLKEKIFFTCLGQGQKTNKHTCRHTQKEYIEVNKVTCKLHEHVD